MTPDEIRAEEQKKQAFKGWATGLYDRLRFGAGGHFNDQGQYVRYPQGLQVTSVQKIAPPLTAEQIQGAQDIMQGVGGAPPPPMQRPTPGNMPGPATGPSTQNIGASEANRPTPQNPAPAPSGPPTQNIPPPPDTTTVAPPQNASPTPAPTGQENQEGGQESRSNNKANETFRRYMKLFAAKRRSE